MMSALSMILAQPQMRLYQADLLEFRTWEGSLAMQAFKNKRRPIKQRGTKLLLSPLPFPKE